MRSGSCPKCQSREVYVKSGGGLHTKGSAYGSQLLVKKALIDLVSYCCATCGYVELYAADQTDKRKPMSRPDALDNGAGWQRVTSQKDTNTG